MTRLTDNCKAKVTRSEAMRLVDSEVAEADERLETAIRQHRATKELRRDLRHVELQARFIRWAAENHGTAGYGVIEFI